MTKRSNPENEKCIINAQPVAKGDTRVKESLNTSHVMATICIVYLILLNIKSYFPLDCTVNVGIF